MSVSLFSSPRTFRVWLFTVSHRILLLRSVKAPGLSTRIDLVFKPVRHMNLPTVLDGIDVRSMRAGDEDFGLGPFVPGETLFFLASLPAQAWVACGTMAAHEDGGDDFDPSHFSVPKMVW